MSRSLPIAEAPMYVECGRRYEILVLRIDENRIVCQTRREIDILDMEQKNMIQCRATFVFGESQSQSAKSSPKERNRFRSCGLRVPTPIKLWTPDFYPPPPAGAYKMLSLSGVSHGDIRIVMITATWIKSFAIPYWWRAS